MVDTTGLPQWGQLLSGTFPPESNFAGGYTIGATSGALTEQEAAQLEKYAVGTSFNLPSGIQNEAAATPEEIHNRPTRLTFADGNYWHSVPAGPDSTGRRGAAFTHALLDRRPNQHDRSFRPIDIWYANQLLVPYSQGEIGAARSQLIDEVTPGVWEPDGLMEFLKSAPGLADNRNLFLGLLDATAYAIDTDTTVVLGVESAERGVQWISAITHLTSLETANQISFSCIDSVHNLPSLIARGVRIVCVPQDDLAQIPPASLPGAVLIAESQPLELNAAAGSSQSGDETAVGTWRTAFGSQFPESSWSVLAAKLFAKERQSPGTVASALLVINELPPTANGEALSPMVPLAIALKKVGMDPSDLRARTAIERAVGEAVFALPADVTADPNLASLVESALNGRIDAVIEAPSEDAAVAVFSGAQTVDTRLLIRLIKAYHAEVVAQSQRQAVDQVKIAEAQSDALRGVMESVISQLSLALNPTTTSTGTENTAHPEPELLSQSADRIPADRIPAYQPVFATEPQATNMEPNPQNAPLHPPAPAIPPRVQQPQATGPAPISLPPSSHSRPQTQMAGIAQPYEPPKRKSLFGRGNK